MSIYDEITWENVSVIALTRFICFALVCDWWKWRSRTENYSTLKTIGQDEIKYAQIIYKPIE